MGFESINYHFVPAEDSADKLEEAVSLIGSELTESDNFKYYVFKGKDFWIDFQLGLFSSFSKNNLSSVSIRTALCNPVENLDKLRTVFTILLNECKGYLFDKTSKNKYLAINNQTWDQIAKTYVQKKKKYNDYFDSLDFAVSCNDVFRTLKKIKSDKGSDRSNDL